VLANDYGVFDDVVPVMLPALDEVGAAHLKSRLAQVLADRSRKAAGRDWQVGAARRALMDIADSQADVDAYIALVPAAERGMPHAAAEIGRRLLAAGRANEALAALETARPKQRTSRARHDDDEFYLAEHEGGSGWEEVHIEALEATGQTEQAQRRRWATFEERLSSTQLRAYLKRLPDFDNVEAEERAMKHAAGFKSFPVVLDFFRGWPNQARAAALVLARASEVDGNMYYLLDPVAQLVEGKHPLAATLLRRAMIEDTLDGAKSSRYKHAARHLLECASLAPGIRDWGSFETHEAFADRLRAKHGRKAGFWTQMSERAEGRR